MSIKSVLTSTTAPLVTLTAILIYGLAWECFFVIVDYDLARFEITGRSLHNMVTHLHPAIRGLTHIAVVGLIITLFGLLQKRRYAIASMAVTIACHLAIWPLAATNPYTDGPMGYVIILLEGLTITALIHLASIKKLR
jgi:hypothetical protein